MPRRLLAALALLGGSPVAALSDEGMWLPTAPPAKVVKERYGFDLSDEFVQKAMRASVRFSGSSGGFVSPDGLVVTNHHVGSDAIQKLSTAGRNLLRDGYYARTRADELKCPDLELNVLQSIEDVTERVVKAVPASLPPDKAAAARRAVLAEIEKESLTKTGLRSDVVTLYQGGLYHLYRSKKYTDVRLVFCPEAEVASFGGDVDNFEYPRHSLDVAFFRVYENGTPAKTPDHFKWSGSGPAAGDLVFVTGHPGATQRLETVAKLKHRRDVTLPYTLARARALEAALIQYGEESPEQRRQAANDLHRVANGRKQFVGQLDGLNDPPILAAKQAAEDELRQAFRAKLSPYAPGLLLPPGELDPWQRVERVQQAFTGFEREYYLFERGDAFASDLFAAARHLVRLADELPRPNAERLREYRDSNLDSLKQQLFSPAPLYRPLEQRKLQTSLAFAAEQLGGDHLTLLKALGGRSPSRQAAELVAGTRLLDVAERKKLFDGGRAAVEASSDPMVVLARRLDADARRLRKRFEEEVDEPERQGFAAIASQRFLTLGTSVPPDATNTFRVAFGTVKGYEVDGKPVPAMTTLGGAFERSAALGGGEPFSLPKRWTDGKAKLDLSVPYNFASTADTIGGNSGSPVLNRAGELVGVNFDRNRHGLVRNFVYTDVQARHIAVHSRAVLETLSKLYDASELVKELTGR
jgi:hypothetical protein